MILFGNRVQAVQYVMRQSATTFQKRRLSIRKDGWSWKPPLSAQKGLFPPRFFGYTFLGNAKTCLLWLRWVVTLLWNNRTAVFCHGVISGALSLFLLAYGGIFSPRSESKQSQNRLEQISRDLAELKGKPKSDLSEDALSRVEEDVRKWAAEFATKKQKKRLILDQRRSEHDSSLEHSKALAREWMPAQSLTLTSMPLL